MALSITSSDTSFISPSTIIMLSMVAATIMSRSAPSSAWKVGFMTNSPLMRATLTSEMGPPNGMSLTASAADAANPARASGIVSLSAEIRFTVTKVSAWKLSGNKGRKALSIRRDTRIS